MTALQPRDYSLVMTALEETEYVRIAPRVFAKRRREEQYFLPTRVFIVTIESSNFKLSRFPKCVLLRTRRRYINTSLIVLAKIETHLLELDDKYRPVIASV